MERKRGKGRRDGGRRIKRRKRGKRKSEKGRPEREEQ